jgi:tRNA threonylcarbamoyl adenosine modification protein YjeE
LAGKDAGGLEGGRLDEDGLRRLARRMARRLGPGGRVFLVGRLGTGKSVFARAVLRELGVRGDIPSPSFIMDAVYRTPLGETHHVDLYRLKGDPREFLSTGIASVLDSEATVIVEWADRLPEALLGEGWLVELEMTDSPGERMVTVERRTLAGD